MRGKKPLRLGTRRESRHEGINLKIWGMGGVREMERFRILKAVGWAPRRREVLLALGDC